MPVRSLGSSILKWPDVATVHQALRTLAAEWAEKHPELRQVAYFGSYARGDLGVGSDLDVLVIVAESADPFWQRALRWDVSQLPVPADVLVYTQAEWDEMGATGGRFYRTMQQEAVWVWPQSSSR